MVKQYYAACGAPSHGSSAWSAPKRPVITLTPAEGEIETGKTVSISVNANCTGTVSKSGYLINGVKVENIDPITIAANSDIIAYAVNSVGGVTIDTEKSYIATSNTKPTISISPESGYFASSISVSVAVNRATEKYYSLDGEDWTAFTSATLDIGADKPAGSVTTLQIKAVNSATSEETTSSVCSYTKSNPSAEVFSWRNANIYFVLTDRFNNGDTSNDHSYGRSVGEVDAANYATRQGTFHGGDIAGLTAKLDYLEALGVNAIWISAPYEQIHGALTSTGFKHYAYHGYYPLDWTGIDKNMGTVETFRTFVNKAHEKGIRIVMDIVMNHAGYANPVDANEYGYGALASNWRDIYYNWSESSYQWYNDYAGEASSRGSSGMMLYDADWITNFWGTSWMRLVGTRFKGYSGLEYKNGTNDQYIGCVGGLPDFITESETAMTTPGILRAKWAKETSGFDNWIIPAAKSLRTDTGKTVTYSIVSWLAAWVEEFGVDGFRCDTAKHIKQAEWAKLKPACNSALAKWRAANSSLAASRWTDNFWMTGEEYDWSINMNDSYFSNGFDSMINFQFPKDGNLGSIGNTWTSYANTINNSANNALSYLSSHDKGLTRANMINQGTCLLLSPGGVQIFYGDETERAASVSGEQGWRSQMTFNTGASTLSHWQKLGKFRRKHIAVGAGSCSSLGDNTYARVYSSGSVSDKVVIKINTSGSTLVNVSGVFADGTTVRNYYDDSTATVASGAVTFTAANGVVLVEAAQ